MVVTGAFWKLAPCNSFTTSLAIKAGLFRTVFSVFLGGWVFFFAVMLALVFHVDDSNSRVS